MSYREDPLQNTRRFVAGLATVLFAISISVSSMRFSGYAGVNAGLGWGFIGIIVLLFSALSKKKLNLNSMYVYLGILVLSLGVIFAPLALDSSAGLVYGFVGLLVLLVTPWLDGIVGIFSGGNTTGGSTADYFVTQVAEKYKRPISASLLIYERRERDFTIENARKLLDRFVRNKQGRLWVDLDGTEYVGIPSVWRDLPLLENKMLNRILEAGSPVRRVELRTWSELTERAFRETMDSLERNGYIEYDTLADSFSLRGASVPKTNTSGQVRSEKASRLERGKKTVRTTL